MKRFITFCDQCTKKLVGSFNINDPDSWVLREFKLMIKNEMTKGYGEEWWSWYCSECNYIIEPFLNGRERSCPYCKEKVNFEFSGGCCLFHGSVIIDGFRYTIKLAHNNKCRVCEKDISNNLSASIDDVCKDCYEKGEWKENMDCMIKRAKIASKWKLGSLPEYKLYQILSEIFEEKIILRKAKPIWLQGIELDICIPELRIAFEYDGKQHFKYSPFWHKTKEKFLEYQKRDRFKDKLCELNNLKLIRLKYDEELSIANIESKIKYFK